MRRKGERNQLRRMGGCEGFVASRLKFFEMKVARDGVEPQHQALSRISSVEIE